ncbi:MAG: hypothetical protein QG670_2385 [Thermoproteota archaeon]|nr:hypothetical protein [Thermoproteota archaeon]
MCASQNELLDYIKRVGENINVIYKRLNDLGTRLDALNKEVNNIKATLESDEASMKNLKNSVVMKEEFDDFVKRLTDSFSAVTQPIELQKEETNSQ